MKKNITKVAYGSATNLEAIICFAKSHTTADFMYYICRVFGHRAIMDYNKMKSFVRIR